jgi:hypothetical protein
MGAIFAARQWYRNSFDVGLLHRRPPRLEQPGALAQRLLQIFADP